MAGIGNRERATPIIRGNRCYRNKMAGIGSRSGARPVIVDNVCHENKFAGIGSQTGAQPVIVNNVSKKNLAAGIGVRSRAKAVIVGNHCVDNRLVAIGVPDGASAVIHGNRLSRTGGMPPLVAVRGGARVLFSGNHVQHGGVAGLLVQGHVTAIGNQFVGRGSKKQGSAIWVWAKSRAVAVNNRFTGYRNALNATGSHVTAADNLVADFQKSAIVIRKSSQPAHVSGTIAVTDEARAKAVVVDSQGTSGGNTTVSTAKGKSLLSARPKLWFETVPDVGTPHKPGPPGRHRDGASKSP